MLNWYPVCVFKSVVCVNMCFLIAKLSQISHSGLAYRNCLLPHWFGFPFLLPCLSPLDSVWAVYILPEEVGTRCTIIGMNVLTLRSGVPNRTVGKLSIINPADPSNPLVSWERDKMRRTGKTGNLVFIEIGRRCQGGPGLVWMYAGSEEAQALRETLHKWVVQNNLFASWMIVMSQCWHKIGVNPFLHHDFIWYETFCFIMSLLKMSFGEGGIGLVGTPAGCVQHGCVGYRKVLVDTGWPIPVLAGILDLETRRLTSISSV